MRSIALALAFGSFSTVSFAAPAAPESCDLSQEYEVLAKTQWGQRQAEKPIEQALEELKKDPVALKDLCLTRRFYRVAADKKSWKTANDVVDWDPQYLSEDEQAVVEQLSNDILVRWLSRLIILA